MAALVGSWFVSLLCTLAGPLESSVLVPKILDQDLRVAIVISGICFALASSGNGYRSFNAGIQRWEELVERRIGSYKWRVCRHRVYHEHWSVIFSSSHNLMDRSTHFWKYNRIEHLPNDIYPAFSATLLGVYQGVFTGEFRDSHLPRVPSKLSGSSSKLDNDASLLTSDLLKGRLLYS